MPRPCEPNQRFPLVLKDDAEASPRPTFYFKSASARDYLAAARERTQEAGPVVAALEFLKGRLVDWENLTDGTGEITGTAGAPIPFDPELFDRVLDVDELVELFYGFSLRHEDKKKSA